MSNQDPKNAPPPPVPAKSILAITSFAELGQMIRTAREKLGYNLVDAAKILGIDNSSLSRIETGQRIPSLDLCARLAGAFDIPPYGLNYVVKHLANNNSSGQPQPQTALEVFQDLSKELLADMRAGRISIQTADQIVSTWEDILTARKGLTSRLHAEKQNSHTHTPNHP